MLERQTFKHFLFFPEIWKNKLYLQHLPYALCIISANMSSTEPWRTEKNLPQAWNNI